MLIVTLGQLCQNTYVCTLHVQIYSDQLAFEAQYSNQLSEYRVFSESCHYFLNWSMVQWLVQVAYGRKISSWIAMQWFKHSALVTN